jgi:hypothetical protein
MVLWLSRKKKVMGPDDLRILYMLPEYSYHDTWVHLPCSKLSLYKQLGTKLARLKKAISDVHSITRGNCRRLVVHDF